MSIREKIMAADGQWLMGRVMPRELLQGIGKYLHRVAPEREDELIEAIKNRAEELIEANEDMVVDGPAEGILGISAVVLAAFEILRPEFDGEERRIDPLPQARLRHRAAAHLRGLLEWITSRENPLDDYEKAVRKQRPMYGSYFDMPLERLDPAPSRCGLNGASSTTSSLATRRGWLPPCSGRDANSCGGSSRRSAAASERTTLLSLGDDACRFRVLETDDPLASFEDALDRRFIDEQGSG